MGAAPAMAAAGGNPMVRYVAIGCGVLFVLSCLLSIAGWALRFMMGSM